MCLSVVLWTIMLQTTVWVLHILAVYSAFWVTRSFWTSSQTQNDVKDTEKQESSLLYVRSTSPCWPKGCASPRFCHVSIHKSQDEEPSRHFSAHIRQTSFIRFSSWWWSCSSTWLQLQYMSSNTDHVRSIISARVLVCRPRFVLTVTH